MKTMFLAGAMLTGVLLSLPADAQVRYRHFPQVHWSRTYPTAPFYRDSTDPDPFIRGQILRDIPERYH